MIAVLGLCLHLLLPVQGSLSFNPEVRVWLTAWQRTTLYLQCNAPWRAVSDTQTRELPSQQSVMVEVKGEQVLLRTGEGVAAAPSWTIEGQAPIRISLSASQAGRAYRPRLVLRQRNGRLQVINILPLEDYLLGVVPLEMPSSFPREALRAQAIAARSWTVRNRYKHEREGFDVCDTTHCQVYGGYDAERDSTTEAVRETAGLVLLQQGLPVDATYTADCGGQPALNGNRPLPPPDRDSSGRDYCEANPRHRWQIDFPIEQFWQKATGQEFTPEVAKQEVVVEAEQIDLSGRVVSVRLRWGERVQLVEATQLRLRLSLPSTLFQIRVEQGRRVMIEGTGAGHGRGLCQWGAAGRARIGQTAEQILQEYYPEATIAPLDEAIWGWRSQRRNSAP